jgi:hypothetical protein
MMWNYVLDHVIFDETRGHEQAGPNAKVIDHFTSAMKCQRQLG